ncbi:MAG: hypothetical protein HY062_01605 [Bacteroidetes bacterium]|nr:hypothetical protein [Bacteroidota bacterium]
MKYISIIAFILFAKVSLSQVNYTDSLKIKIIDLAFVKDTTSRPYKYVLNFKLNIQPVANLDSVTFSIFDQNGSLYTKLNAYVLKKHPTGFYYLENNIQEKTTVLNYDAPISKSISIADYMHYWSIKLTYTSKVNVTKNTTYTIPR